MPLLLILALACFASSLNNRVIDPLVTVLAREYSVAAEQAALLATVYGFAFAFAQPILGPMGDALGKARIIRACLAAMVATFTLAALATSIEWLFAARILSGATSAGIIPLSFAIVGDRFAMGERQVALSRLLLAMMIGHLIGAMGTGIVAAALGWRAMMAVGAVVALAALVTASVAPSLRNQGPRKSVSPAAIRAGYASVFANRRAIVCYTGVFVGGMVVMGLMPFIAVLLERRGAGGVREAGFVVAALGLGGAVYAFLVKALLRRLGPWSAMRVGGLLAGAGLVAAAFTRTWQQDVAVFFVIGVGYFMVHNGLQTQATELSAQARGAAASLHSFSYFLGHASGPIVYGLALSLIGGPAMLLAGAIVMSGLGFWVAQRLSRGCQS